MNKTVLFFCILLCISCHQVEIPKQPDGEFTQIVIKEANTTPTVDIPDFILITNNLPTDSINAIKVLEVKRAWPLAMQRKDSLLFENILAKNFTFRAEGEFFSRTDYINDRIHGAWSIDTVTYKNMVLQFFDNVAVLTYRNSLHGKDSAGRNNIEHYSWADIYHVEKGEWKILGSHLIEAKVEYPTD